MALGTSSQVPTRYRNHNGYLLRLDREDFLFDPGEGTQLQMARARVGVERLRRVLLTHFHGDHCLGLAGVLQLINAANVGNVVEFHFPVSGLRYYERAICACIYDLQAKFEPRPVRALGLQMACPELRIYAQKLSHGVPTIGYRVEIQQKSSSNPFVLAFAMDTRRCAGARLLAEGADVLISECTYLSSEAKEAEERGHMTAAHAAELAVEAGVKHLMLTHFSQRYPGNRPFLEEAQAIHGRVTALSDLRTYILAD